MRDLILSEIRRLAASIGDRPPGQQRFAQETDIAAHQWRGKYWARWGDALVEAGYQPNDWTERLDPNQLLLGVAAVCRHFGRLPTSAEMAMYRKSAPSTPSEGAIRRHFGGHSMLVGALAKRAADDSTWADIVAMLPQSHPSAASSHGGSTKGRSGEREREGLVYLIQSGNFYKIGRSDDLERRVKEIRVALPDKATLVHSIRTDDPSGIEGYWHQRFKDKRANGEWFKLSSSDVAAFTKRKFQ